MDYVKPKSVLADCPYCEGTGSDAGAWDRRCGRCNGRGRMARFLVEEILARWAVNGRPGGNRVGSTVGSVDKSADSEAGGADGAVGDGRDDDPEPPRPYRFRPAA